MLPKMEMTLLEFIQRYVASESVWQEYSTLADLKDPGIVGIIGHSQINSPALFRRFELEQAFRDQIVQRLREGAWKLEGRWHTSSRSQEIQPSLLRELRLQPYRNRA